jgi:hypothetical protein
VYNCESEDEEVVFRVVYEDFVYAVALSDSRVAVGGVAKTVEVFDMEIQTDVPDTRFECHDTVWGLAFDGRGQVCVLGVAARTAAAAAAPAPPGS